MLSLVLRRRLIWIIQINVKYSFLANNFDQTASNTDKTVENTVLFCQLHIQGAALPISPYCFHLHFVDALFCIDNPWFYGDSISE